MGKKFLKIFTKSNLRRRLSAVILFLACLNFAVLIYSILSSRHNHVLLGLVVIAYGLGLRHAVDADHIAAIDNTTRKLMHDGKRPIGVGLFFSLGHSTVVIIVTGLIAFSAAFIKNSLPKFKVAGAIIGLSISSFFLLLIGIGNLIVLLGLFKKWRSFKKTGIYKENDFEENQIKIGFIVKIFQPVLKIVDESWKMYFVGFLFGLGFDTASEIALLSISAGTAAPGMPIGNILILPFAFVSAMSTVDTLDGILMLGAYGWAKIKSERKLYYNLNVTFISVAVAIFIGTIEALQAISSVLGLKGKLFDGLRSLTFDNLGYIIIGIFIVGLLLSVFSSRVRKI